MVYLIVSQMLAMVRSASVLVELKRLGPVGSVVHQKAPPAFVVLVKSNRL